VPARDPCRTTAGPWTWRSRHEIQSVDFRAVPVVGHRRRVPRPAGRGGRRGATGPAGDQGTPPAQNDDDKENVQKRLEELEQKLLILERQKEVEQEAAAGKAKDAGTVSAGKDGFVIKSADGDYLLKIRALVQADGRFWDGQETRPLTDTFELRRARPILEGTVGKLFDFRLTPDFAEGKSTLFDAYVDWRFAPWIRLRAGKFKPPVGLERLQSASDIDFVERALPTNLVPNRDVGLQLGGDVLEGSSRTPPACSTVCPTAPTSTSTPTTARRRPRGSSSSRSRGRPRSRFKTWGSESPRPPATASER